MKTWKKIGLGLSGGFLGLCVLLVGARFLPFPIEGNWAFSTMMASDGHVFIRFEKGKVLLMSSDADYQPFFLGTYQRKGWGKYEASDESFPGVLHSTFLLMTRSEIQNGGTSWGHIFYRAPFILTCRKIVNHPSNEWMSPVPRTRMRITGTPDDRRFITMGVGLKKEDVEEWFDQILTPPLIIYTASNEVPSSLIETLVESGIASTVYTNQEWIVSEMRKEKPGWSTQTKRSFMFNYSLTIAPPQEEKYGITGNIFYLMHEGPLSLHDVEAKIKTKQRNRDCWEKDDVHLYVKDGILSEDVRELFEQFDLEYTVLDERVLYRGKSKDPYAKKGGTP